MNIRVLPSIRLLNKYVNRFKRVAISSILPELYADEEGKAFPTLNIQVEGPARHVRHFNRLLDEAKLKIS